MSKQQRTILVLGAVVLVIGTVLWVVFSGPENTQAEAVVDRGDVTRSVTVSGYLEADNVADLSFPQSARITALLVREGDWVSAGDVLATTGNGALAAQRRAASASVTEAVAARDELLNGLTLEARAVSGSTVAQAAEALATTRVTEANRVAQARANLYSTDLVARSTDAKEDATRPTVSGSYQCKESGVYILEVYRSNADSGYSVRISGLESDTKSISYTQPVAIGDCGLSVQFTEGDLYSNSVWEITIPNENSSTYLSRLRTYELTVAQAEQNITAAEYTYQLAQDVATRDTAAPRVEAMLAANAAVVSAQANLERIDALLGDETLVAPFDGIVSNITTREGETATGPILSVVANDRFTLIARIPEIDITRVKTQQPAVVFFDAAHDTPITASVSYIAPTASVIDGVSYYETSLTLQSYPDWLRDGLNADINIEIEKQTNALRVPSRFISTEKEATVHVRRANTMASSSIDILLTGTDGYSAISGLKEGDTVVAP